MLARISTLALLVAVASALPNSGSQCEPVDVQKDFNLTKYTSHKWFIQKQQAIKYLPANERYCVVATYEQKDASHVKVHNYANIDKVNGKVDDSDTHVKKLGGICGKGTDVPAKLEVGPCDLSIISRFAFGPYWVVAAGDLSCVGADCPQPEEYEWAFVSGGQPTVKTDGGCTPGTGVNHAGMWIFTKAAERNQTLLDAVDAIGTQKGFDMSALGDVVQEGCKYAPAPTEAEAVQDETEVKGEEPCCQGACQAAGTEKYYSIAKGLDGTPHCGECCMEPKHYNLYHFFEKNLTKADSNSPCKGFGFGQYDSTVTHGVWPVKMTLDLYNH